MQISSKFRCKIIKFKIYQIPVSEWIEHLKDVLIKMIQIDSRKVKEGDIFVAIKGFNFDGHNFIKQAEENGASKIYCEKKINDVNIPQVIVENSRKAAGELASEFYGFPTKSFKLVGVTGTNGKTTTTYMVKSILESTGEKVGLIGTNQNMIGTKALHTERTTPDSVDLQELFGDMRDAKCEYVVMEVSSHALALDRVAGSYFEVGAFTNLTQDHLDFHKDFEDYFAAKCKLFEMADKKVINVDNEWGRRIVAMNLPNTMQVRASDINFQLPSNIVGQFNYENAAVARGICIQLGLTNEQIIKGFANFKGVNGRMELVYDADFKVIIDYAHTPDGLSNILKTAREFCEGRLVVVFGCGGDRDKAKRPIMGRIASELADICIVTSDNPRTEKPEEIINEILMGMDECDNTIITNRREAIEYALKNAKKDDVIILAGKGHEDYQIIGTEKHHFDEHEIVGEILKLS